MICPSNTHEFWRWYLPGPWHSFREPPVSEGQTLATRPPHDTEDAAVSLTLAVIVSSPTPLLLLDGELRIVGASDSFCGAFEIDSAAALGSALSDLGAGEWDVSRLSALLSAITTGTPQTVAFEMELERPDRDTRCLIINARLLVYEDPGRPRLLVAVADVTEARANKSAKDAIIEQLGVLLHEVRHRVANSLQIVSAVLLQNARRTTSAETRDNLKDAHHRVMAVATLERQLSASPNGDESVELRTYFSDLCASIAASMIGDDAAVALVVTGGGLVPSRVSVSLGLIVTELVINALKHAFPAGRAGRIEIGYKTHGPNWTLSVGDDGVGMPKDSAPIRRALGTSIVQSLARQLDATVEMVAGAPGTIVCIDHIQVALVDDNETERAAAASPAERLSGRARTAAERSHADGHAVRR